MKKLLLPGVVSFFIGITTIVGFVPCGSQDGGFHKGNQDRFVGAWRLAWLEEPGADGRIHRADCTGLLVYTRDSHMSVQVMYREPQAATQPGQVHYAQGGYEASFGTYVVDERSHTFTFHVDGSLVRTLIGKDLLRAYEFSGNQLIVRSVDLKEHWRVAWEHY